MASIGIQSGGKLSLSFLSREKPNMIISPSHNFFIPNCGRRVAMARQCLLSSSNSPIASPPCEVGKSDSQAGGVGGASLERIDSWMEDSVEDIVRNLKEAPLLVQIYGDGDGDGGGSSQRRRVRIQTEKALSGRWGEVNSQWRRGESRPPDGLIFVDELEENPNGDGDDEEQQKQKGCGGSRAWGLVVQGKGVDCSPSCYLLKTDSVCGGIGLGFCTHFCLMKVNNFRDTALEQFRVSWLLQ